jgi:hypothetical protein
MNPFLTYLIASIVVSVVWTVLLLKADHLSQRSLGLAGTWVANLVLASLWQSSAVPWLWDFLQLVLLIWLIAILFLVIAAASVWSAKQPSRLPLVCCALMSIVVNVAAGLHFLWIATVSPAGV